MLTAFLCAVLAVSPADKPLSQNPDMIKRVERFAEGLQKRAMPDAKLVRMPLTLAGDSLTFMAWLPPADVKGKFHPFTPKVKLDFQDNPAAFGKWASGFMDSRRLMITYFSDEQDAKAFEADWLSLVSRNATGLRVKRIGGEVIWGSGELLDRL